MKVPTKFHMAFRNDQAEVFGVRIICDHDPRIDDFGEDVCDPIAIALGSSDAFMQALVTIVGDPGSNTSLYELLSTVAQAGFDAGFEQGRSKRMRTVDDMFSRNVSESNGGQ